ncbi:hypothetical protein F0145_20140 [Adhaeribacter rhizoryzae]|uniref:Poliovirus 3A protein-like domain-containing protein n=1 Tax=Adhaeribacter rhizoryzae TaxID=2607907 RepID=A0A5M6D318_9BACT|nr:hypothetical protein F0145_20140 [Adhaeribacter rhizoryzae]
MKAPLLFEFLGVLAGEKLTDKVIENALIPIESVNDFLKNICQIEHIRYCSKTNWLVNFNLGLIVYSFLPNKRKLKF